MALGLGSSLTGEFVPSGVTLLLDEDDVPAAAVAVGMRKLRKDYTGYAMRVTSYSNNSNIADVSFDSNGLVSASSPVTQAGGSITASTLGELSGSDYLYTTIWYDQSGNSRNFTNSTLTSQPFITSAGTSRTLRCLTVATISWDVGMSFQVLATTIKLGRQCVRAARPTRKDCSVTCRADHTIAVLKLML